MDPFLQFCGVIVFFSMIGSWYFYAKSIQEINRGRKPE